MTDEVIISVDLGGTRLRAARLDTHLNILERYETLTKADEGFNAVIDRIKDVIHHVMPEDKSTVLGIGISAPGPLNPETGVVVAPPNLPGWSDVPLADILYEEFEISVYVGNDANVAALAEVAIGEAVGSRDAIYLTISTGVGSGIINNGRLLLGQTGLAGEAGHIILVTEEGNVSTFEKEVAGPALARQARERIRNGESTILAERMQGDLESIDAKMIGQAANDGDEMAVQIVQRAGRMAGLGIVSLLHLFNPEKVVIGGGVSYIGDLLFDEIHKTVKQHTIDDDYWKDTPIVPSRISEDVSLYGAAMLVLTRGGRKDTQKMIDKFGVTEDALHHEDQDD